MRDDEIAELHRRARRESWLVPIVALLAYLIAYVWIGGAP